MISSGANILDWVRSPDSRAWAGVGDSPPLKTSRSVRLSVHFCNRSECTAQLAVWACIVPPGTMPHGIVLDRDSCLRFNTHAYDVHKSYGKWQNLRED